jgi:hypothetical protein
MGTARGLIDVAYSYLGTTEDDPRFTELIDYYNANTDGYDMRYWDEWCACFVSVCSLKSGNADVTGTSVNCAVFRNIWKEKGIYREGWETPETGWLIDYDWEQDGIPDHIGIVVDCDGSTIHVIEGNTDGEMCAEHWIPVGSPTISCFGAPRYAGNPKAGVHIHTPNQTIAQQWRFEDAGDGRYFLKCCDRYLMLNKSLPRGDGYAVCAGPKEEAQAWELVQLREGEPLDKPIHLIAEGLYLDVVNGVLSSGAGVQARSKSPSKHGQKWAMVWAGEDSTYYLHNLKSDMCLDVDRQGR